MKISTCLYFVYIIMMNEVFIPHLCFRKWMLNPRNPTANIIPKPASPHIVIWTNLLMDRWDRTKVILNTGVWSNGILPPENWVNEKIQVHVQIPGVQQYGWNKYILILFCVWGCWCSIATVHSGETWTCVNLCVEHFWHPLCLVFHQHLHPPNILAS